MARLFFYLVVIGQGVNVLGTLASVGDPQPTVTPLRALIILCVCFIAAPVQIAALYLAAKESTHEGRWIMAHLMAVISLVAIVGGTKIGANAITAGDALLVIAFAVASCSVLIWLRRSRVKRQS